MTWLGVRSTSRQRCSAYPAVTKIITIPEALKPLDDAIAEIPRRNIPAEAHELLADSALPLYDRVINASHAPLGSWLAATIPCANPDDRYGGVIRDRECLYSRPRSAYRRHVASNFASKIFSISSMYIRAIPGIPATPSAQGRLSTSTTAWRFPSRSPGSQSRAQSPRQRSRTLFACRKFRTSRRSSPTAGFAPILVGAPSIVELCKKSESPLAPHPKLRGSHHDSRNGGIARAVRTARFRRHRRCASRRRCRHHRPRTLRRLSMVRRNRALRRQSPHPASADQRARCPPFPRCRSRRRLRNRSASATRPMSDLRLELQRQNQSGWEDLDSSSPSTNRRPAWRTHLSSRTSRLAPAHEDAFSKPAAPSLRSRILAPTYVRRTPDNSSFCRG